MTVHRKQASSSHGVARRLLLFIMLKIEAEEFSLLKSSTLVSHFRLPHNFVHRKCEEARTPRKASGADGGSKLVLTPLSVNNS